MNAHASSLDSSVLVLNKFYMALRVISVRRAFALLWGSKAEVIAQRAQDWSSYDLESWLDASRLRQKFDGHDEWIKTVSFDIQVPRIIRLVFYNKVPKKKVKLNRRNIYARDHNTCQYCGKRFPTSELSLDHVTPRSKGGRSSWTNLVCACTRCNNQKAGKTVREANKSLLCKPTEPKYSPLMRLIVRSEKYQSWKQFLDNAYWSIELNQE
jgi:5-methylcytosine-specific restriction endonuclease McrA